jgi:heat shock protein HslJ
MSQKRGRAGLFSVLLAFGSLLVPQAGLAVQVLGASSQPVRFENSPWIILSYFDGQSLIDSRAATSIAFVDGRVQGTGNCGPFGGEYYLSDGVVRIHAETILSDGPCFEVNLKEAQAILDALNTGERRIEQRAGRVVLRDFKGAIQIVLTPAQ